MVPSLEGGKLKYECSINLVPKRAGMTTQEATLTVDTKETVLLTEIEE
jgi:hypothetical protein